MRHMRYTPCFFILLASLAGCAPVDREKLAQEVVAKDPEFASVLEKQKELSGRIQTYERELIVRRTETQKKIDQLRKDLADAASVVRAKTADVKKRMDPDKQRLELSLTAAAGELALKRQERANLGKEIVQLKKSGQGASGELEQLLRQTEQLDSLISDRKENVRLLKIKLLLIKL